MAVVLNAENNESYAYLKSVGNTWKYNADKVHPNLKARLYKRFDTFDLNHDKVMKMHEVLFWADRMKKLFDSNQVEIETLRSAIRTFFGAIGVTKAGLARENWVEGNQVFGEAEREREKRGKKSLVALISNAYYDVLDTDGKRTVSFEELKTMMRAFEVPEEAAYAFFEKADINKDGKLLRPEMTKLFKKFWLETYDPQYDGIYAYKY